MLGLGNNITSKRNLSGFTWIPTDKAGIALWHQNLTNVGVDRWDDQSGNERHAAQGTSANQAAVYKGGLHFDGVNDFYEYTEEINIDTEEAYTLALVYELDSTSAKNTVFSKNANSTFFEFFDADTLRINYVGSNVQINDGNHAAGAVRSLIVTRSTSGVHKLYEGNDTVVDTVTQTGIAAWENFGVRNDNDRWFDGKIYEEMVWDNVEISGTDLDNLIQYTNNVQDSIL